MPNSPDQKQQLYSHLFEHLAPYQNNLEAMELVNQWTWMQKRRLKQQLQQAAQ